MKKAKDGDKDALLNLIMSEKQEYYKLAYIYMKNSEDALEAMGEMILILYQNIYKIRDEKSFYSWSKTILVNCCKNRLKKNKKIILLEDINTEIYEEDFNSKDEKIVLEKHLNKLSTKHQEIIKLRYYLDMDYKNIAELIKVPVGTVKSRISFALKKLKESLGGENI